MKKFLVLSFLVLFASSAHAVSFSPLEMLQQESQNTSSGVLSSVLNAYNPEDFLTVSIIGNPEVVREKANTFRVNAEMSFNTEMYYDKFIPEVVSALEEVSEKTRKTTGYLVELNDRPAPFGPKFFAFNDTNTQKVSAALSEFRTRALRVKGVNIELQDSNGRTVHTITKPVTIQHMIFEAAEGNNRSVWTLSPVIVNFTDNKRTIDSKLNFPVEFEIPSMVISSVSGMNASVYAEGDAQQNSHKKQGWFGAGVADVRPKGAVINRVLSGGSAEKAGLRKGDIILSLNGEEVISGASFAQKIGTFREGDTVTMTVSRYGKSYNVRITLEARPE